VRVSRLSSRVPWPTGVAGVPVVPGVDGVDELIKPSDLAVIEMIHDGRPGLLPQTLGGGLELVEVGFGLLAVVADGVDLGFGLVYRGGGSFGHAIGGAAVPEAGLAGVVVGGPHRRPELPCEACSRV
jgi:hypothetical protein